MGPRSAAATAPALFLEMVCCSDIALARCFCCFHGPEFYCSCRRAWLTCVSLVPPDSVSHAAALFLEIVCCSIARRLCLRLVSVIPALLVGARYVARGPCACLHVSHCHTLHDDIHPLQTATYRFIRIALPKRVYIQSSSLHQSKKCA
ncbi:hypothetical protein EV421DRAFT_368646 [Armillaria borealis]|uniref:Secreted protein n=1 Tax=Armillaria borealis TaxID=47425 RepID=A0AA39JL44_9AGAR|nr:hypothetical protein EV421DRAFT_368646 [Armillaria borealis]